MILELVYVIRHSHYFLFHFFKLGVETFKVLLKMGETILFFLISF